LFNPVQRFIDADVGASSADYTDLRAVVINGSWKPSPEISHTDGLIAVSRRAPSYLDPQGGAGNAWTTRNTVFAAWNMLHTARMLKDAGGVPPHGNVTTNWDLSNPSAPNPEYR
jgi:hypothetical protein